MYVHQKSPLANMPFVSQIKPSRSNSDGGRSEAVSAYAGITKECIDRPLATLIPLLLGEFCDLRVYYLEAYASNMKE